MILSDFNSHFPLIVADNLKIPVVVNAPCPLALMYVNPLPGLVVNKGCTRVCCGSLCICADPLIDLVRLAKCVYKTNRLQTTIKNRIVLVNSYFGLERPISLPPNVTMTGPLVGE